MKQRQFEHKYTESWQELEEHLSERKKNEPDDKPAITDFPAMYRQLCHQLALAKDRHYSPVLIEKLTDIAVNGHQQLYRHRTASIARIARYLGRDFPMAIRREWRLVVLAALCFYLPLFGIAIWIQFQPEIVYTLLKARDVFILEQMYRPELDTLGRERESDTNMYMFGFYIRNNASIGLQTFAGGLLAGVGSLFFLLFNGFYIGAVAGHLIRVGLGPVTFLPFVSGHSATELTAIVLSGAAGFMLGRALLSPGRLARGLALRRAAKQAMTLVWGTMVLFVIAAAIEAFWSSSTSIPPVVKYAFGILQWVLLLAYILFMGRRHES